MLPSIFNLSIFFYCLLWDSFGGMISEIQVILYMSQFFHFRYLSADIHDCTHVCMRLSIRSYLQYTKKSFCKELFLLHKRAFKEILFLNPTTKIHTHRETSALAQFNFLLQPSLFSLLSVSRVISALGQHIFTRHVYHPVLCV